MEAETKYMSETLRRRMELLEKPPTLETFCLSFDLSAFPLPMRVAIDRHGIFCCDAGPNQTAHVFMKIKPRNADELSRLARDADGMIELKTCTSVTEQSFKQNGSVVALEKIRTSIRDMVLHEVYEALLFRKERIFDPHQLDLRPEDQPF